MCEVTTNQPWAVFRRAHENTLDNTAPQPFASGRPFGLVRHCGTVWGCTGMHAPYEEEVQIPIGGELILRTSCNRV